MFTVDAIEGVVVDPDKYPNEIGSICTLYAGLRYIAEFLKRREALYEQATGGKLRVFTQGLDIDGTKKALPLIACMFHWFGGSVCNLARLAGFIRGLEKGEFTRSHLADPDNYDLVKKSVNAYAKGLPELANVLRWRNKVGAHFAITDPWKDDNLATLDMSVLFPVAFVDGLYADHATTLTISNSAGTFTSEIPTWSVTEVFESLIPRYWPGLAFGGPPKEPDDGSSSSI